MFMTVTKEKERKGVRYHSLKPGSGATTGQKVPDPFSPLSGMVVLLFMTIPCTVQASAANSTIRHHQKWSVDSGVHDNHDADFKVVALDTLTVPGSSWMRVRFGKYNLGRRSYITVTSAKDGAQQRLDSHTLANWSNLSAFFNGGQVDMTLHVAPGELGIYVRTTEVVYGRRTSPQAHRSANQLCGLDSREPSNSVRVGRLQSGGGSAACTIFIASNGSLLTAGHCQPQVFVGFDIAEFNIEQSDCNGDSNVSAPEHQYPIDAVVGFDYGLVGNDYAVVRCMPNGYHPSPAHGQGDFFRMSRDDEPVFIRITGCGEDRTPSGCEDDLNSDNKTVQTSQGPFVFEYIQTPTLAYMEYVVDGEQSNSGSPIINTANDVVLGIHTSGGCVTTGVNAGTSFKNEALAAALHNFLGPNVVYVDDGHPGAIKDGTVLRPYSALADAVAAATSGALISIVKGNYPAGAGNTFVAGADGTSMTLEATVGTVVIGD